MSKEFDYTSLARRFSARFPVFTYLSIQINFWMVANILLGTIMYLQSLTFSEAPETRGRAGLGPIIIIAVIIGTLYGTLLGFADYFLDRNIFKKQPLGKIILVKTVISLLVLVFLFMFIRFVLFDVFLSPSVYDVNFTMGNRAWKYVFYITVIYYFFMTLVISFINQVNKKYGPGILIPLLLGKYRNPQEEERIFMFMDLKSSTTMAEELGHLKYSSFIRDSFLDINQVLMPYHAEVYQYVGDEIVVTWRSGEGLRNLSCIRFFFACEKQLLGRTQYYIKHYGFLPHFKAGLHMGMVTAVEIGEIKRDIAYHGDTLNTAARIQSICNDHNKNFLISEYLLEKISANNALKTEALGMIQLKGKTAKVGIASVEGIRSI